MRSTIGCSGSTLLPWNDPDSRTLLTRSIQTFRGEKRDCAGYRASVVPKNRKGPRPRLDVLRDAEFKRQNTRPPEHGRINGYSLPLIRVEDYRRLIDESTYRADRVRPCGRPRSACISALRLAGRSVSATVSLPALA